MPTKPRGHLREIVSHGSVFGIGLVISRLTSIVLLPVYTHVLRPEDYGVVAVLDFVGELLRLTVTTGLMSAVGRYHFEYEDARDQSKVWWTALVVLVGLATGVAALLLPASGAIARVTIGSELHNGAVLYALMLGTFWVGTAEGLFQSHLRLMKRSQLYVTLSVVRLLFNASINILLLYKFNLGVTAVLAGNLATGVVWTIVQFVIFVRLRGPMVLDLKLLRPMARFGAPLMGVALLSMGMHQLDRYLLLLFVNLRDIGIYQFAYQIGQGINSLILLPFAQIWSVVVFDIARHEDANRTFALVFRYFSRALLLLLLAAALGSAAAVRFLAAPDYAAAADLIPIVALAYFFFSLDDHFRVPALVRKQTIALLPVYAIAVAMNVVLNLALIPTFGIVGAAWASVGTFVGFSIVGLRQYRKIDRIEYPLREVALVGLTCIGVYLAFRTFVPDRDSLFGMVIAAAIWLTLAALLLRQPWRLWRENH